MIRRRVLDAKARIVPIFDELLIHIPAHVAVAPHQAMVIDVFALPIERADDRILESVRIVVIAGSVGGNVQPQLHVAPFPNITGDVAINVHNAFVRVVPLTDAVPHVAVIPVIHIEKAIMHILFPRYFLAFFIIGNVGKDLGAGVNALHVELDFTGGAGGNVVLDIVKRRLGFPAAGDKDAADLFAERLAVGQRIGNL